MKKSKDSKELFITSVLRVLTGVLIVTAALLLIVNTVLHIESNSTALRRYELSYQATQFLNTSTYLTSEVRAFANTGDKTHADNYWNEVRITQTREQSVAALKELGITEEEAELVDRMFHLSENLSLHEARAIELVEAGDVEAAINIVYGISYSSSTAQIRALREELRVMLDERTSKELNKITVAYNIVDVITWILVILVIIIQFIQKKMLYRLAYIDHLTEGLNYYAFRQKMSNGIHIYRRGYVISADLKNFNIVNDGCGVVVGDEIIRRMWKILERSLLNNYETELAAHVSGDRFVMLLQCKDDRELVSRLKVIRADIIKIADDIEIPYLFPVFGIQEVTNSYNPEQSYGDACFASSLLKKNNSSVFYSFFNKEMQAETLENHRMEDNFESALHSHQFEVWYQPKYSTDRESCVAAEALVRLRKDDGSIVSPGIFIPLFEHNGLISQLDKYVFNEVCAKQRAWLDRGLAILPISINISRATLLRPNVVERYVSIMNRHNIPLDCVELELTETAMNHNDNMYEILMQFRTAGIRMLVDDFGVGYSSLSVLTYGCFTGIKLDKSLTEKIDSAAGARMVEIITNLAHEFSMHVTAEGVETTEQLIIIKGSPAISFRDFCIRVLSPKRILKIS